MAFGFGGSSNGGATKGYDLETIQTEALGFLSIAGDAKVRLTSSWSDLPSATSSLLSVASKKGLVAAAGPDQIIIATTEAIRKAFESPKDGDSDIRDFQPQLKVPMPMRVSQLVFTADENYLVLSAESGGGLAVYEVQSLLQGSSSSAFELSTNGEALRALVPNPTPEKAELVAIVTNGGTLHMANLKDRSISNALKTHVSCVSWSSKGKQLCAGLADGSIYQMTPEGEGKAEIPPPPGLSNCHVSSLIWLENNLFLAIHSTTDSPPSSTYNVITRQSPSAFEYRQLTDPIEPFGSEKTPYHTFLRLRDFPPNLQDLLIVTSTASTEVGLLTRSKSPLANDKTPDSITNVFTTTELLDDTKRPTLPMTDSMDDSTAIGIALDLSAKDKVYKPIPSDDELEESPSPLPGFWILTHEGVLCSWWVVYTDSVKQGTTYPGLAINQDSSVEQTPAPAVTTAGPFSSSATGPSPFASSTSAAPAFGSSAQLGQKPSPWGTPGSMNSLSTTGGASFGSSTFGASTSATPAFGKSGFSQPSQLGARASPWGSAGGASATPAFGQSGFSSLSNQSGSSAFGASTSSQTPSAAPTSGGFAGFASKGGFASLAGNNSGSSIFGSGGKPAGSAFGMGSADTAFPPKSESVFGTPQSKTPGGVFGGSQENPAGSVFGSTPFKLQSSFKPDPSAQEDAVKSVEPSGSSMFGSTFGSALNDASSNNALATTSAKDEDMDTAEISEETPKSKPSIFPSSIQSQESTTPLTAPAASRLGSIVSPPPAPVFDQAKEAAPSAGGFFGASKAATTTSVFGTNLQDASKPSDAQAQSAVPNIFGLTVPTEKSESALSGHSKPKKSVTIIEPAPLPPDPTSHSAETSKSSDFVEVSRPEANESASKAALGFKLPDTTSASPAATGTSIFSKTPITTAPSSFAFPKTMSTQPSEFPSLNDGDSDVEEDNGSEGSGIDVAKDLSPTLAGMASGFSPQSSLGIGQPQHEQARPLFGEVSRNAPVMVPRSSANAIDQRTLSPARGSLVPNRGILTETSRAVSTPIMTSQISGLPSAQLNSSITSRGKPVSTADTFLAQQKKVKERQDAEEARLLIDEEDDEVQRVLASDIEPTLELDEFIAHSNVAPPAKDSVPAQVEAVYRDINSMIDTLGLNARSVKAFTQGHAAAPADTDRDKDDLEDPDGWVLCEIGALGEVLDSELAADLEDGRVRNLPDKLDECQNLMRELHRLRAKQEDLKRGIAARMDPTQAEISVSLPLSAEQATQQNELRREFTNFSKTLAETEEALTLLKTRIASISSSTGRGNSNVPTVEAVIRTIAKMTSMVEKRSGDIDVLETQLRRLRLESGSREGSPLRTSQLKRSILMSLDTTPSRGQNPLSSSIMSLGGSSIKGFSPKKKISGFSREEKGELMDKRAKRQVLLARLKENVQKKGVSVWTMEDIE